MLIPWIYTLKENEQLLIESPTRRWVVNGPRLVLTRPLERARRRKGHILGSTDYLLMRNDLTGQAFNVLGPCLYFPGADEVVLAERQMTPLKQNQYMRLLDTLTGAMRVVQGEASVVLQPTETIVTNISEGINVDEHTAVIILDNLTGQRSLVTKHQVFIPAAHQEIVGVSKRIRLEDHEVVVIRDRQGRYEVHQGTAAERSFFLDPYSELVKFCWSTGLHKEKRSLQFEKIDTRPKFMWYEFEARTKDNVELVIGITFFWQIVNVQNMIHSTDDTPGDVCSHARSAIIQSVSKVTLENFLADFNRIVSQAVLSDQGEFYDERGVCLHAVEVRSVSCKDDKTQLILNEIIREATDRLNLLEKTTSENEIRLKRLGGEIEAEAMKGRLLAVQAENERTAADIAGQAEAQRVKAFLDGLGEALAPREKLDVFNLLRKGEMLGELSRGSAQLYFTPADINLSIEAHPGS